MSIWLVNKKTFGKRFHRLTEKFVHLFDVAPHSCKTNRDLRQVFTDFNVIARVKSRNFHRIDLAGIVHWGIVANCVCLIACSAFVFLYLRTSAVCAPYIMLVGKARLALQRPFSGVAPVWTRHRYLVTLHYISPLSSVTPLWWVNSICLLT